MPCQVSRRRGTKNSVTLECTCCAQVEHGGELRKSIRHASAYVHLSTTTCPPPLSILWKTFNTVKLGLLMASSRLEVAHQCPQCPRTLELRCVRVPLPWVLVVQYCNGQHVAVFPPRFFVDGWMDGRACAQGEQRELHACMLGRARDVLDTTQVCNSSSSLVTD